MRKLKNNDENLRKVSKTVSVTHRNLKSLEQFKKDNNLHTVSEALNAVLDELNKWED